MKKYTEIDISAIAADSNRTLLQSIGKHGIVSPNKISATVSSNQTAQTSTVQEGVCVNYVDLRKADRKAREIAFEAAFNEEYLGVFGISLERSHSLQAMLKPELLMQEIQARITHQVLFILQPPSLLPFRGKPFAAQDSVDLAYYSPKEDDGFSQARSKSVFTGSDIPVCSNVTEIKTDKDFSIEKKDVIAILVPEHLFETCHEIFSATGIDIISVSSSQKTLRCLPQILEMSFKETLTDPLSLHVPKYATVLDAYCLQNKISHFSLHAVRLNTDFDFTLRPIANGHLHQAVLKSVHARIAHQNEDGLAWAVIHKKYGQSKDELIKNLSKYWKPAHLECFLRINSHSMDNFKQLAFLKGEHLINRTYATLHSGQVYFLLKHGIDLARTPYYFMMHCSKEKTPLLKKVIDDFETIQQEQATVIQSHVRGYHCQKFFKGYQKAKHKMEAAQYEMEANKQWLLSKIR